MRGAGTTRGVAEVGTTMSPGAVPQTGQTNHAAASHVEAAIKHGLSNARVEQVNTQSG